MKFVAPGSSDFCADLNKGFKTGARVSVILCPTGSEAFEGCGCAYFNPAPFLVFNEDLWVSGVHGLARGEQSGCFKAGLCSCIKAMSLDLSLQQQ